MIRVVSAKNMMLLWSQRRRKFLARGRDSARRQTEFGVPPLGPRLMASSPLR
jgi:hypothetical protein